MAQISHFSSGNYGVLISDAVPQTFTMKPNGTIPVSNLREIHVTNLEEVLEIGMDASTVVFVPDKLVNAASSELHKRYMSALMSGGTNGFLALSRDETLGATIITAGKKLLEHNVPVEATVEKPLHDLLKEVKQFASAIKKDLANRKVPDEL